MFNQSVLFAVACALATLIGGYALAGSLRRRRSRPMRRLRPKASTYLYWFLPGLALGFAQVVMGSALRGTGIVKPDDGDPSADGAAEHAARADPDRGLGHGLRDGRRRGRARELDLDRRSASCCLPAYFLKLEKYVGFDRELWRPQLQVWKRMLDVGLPAGGEFALMFIYMGVIYWVISDFGAAAQAGFGIGSRIMQSIFMPAMAIAFAAGPIAGQNFGAKQGARVRETFAKALMLNTVVMVLVTVFLQWRPEVLVGVLHARSRGASRRRDVPAHHLVDLHRAGRRVHVLGRVPGPRQHDSGDAELGDSARGVRAARRLAGRAARASISTRFGGCRSRRSGCRRVVSYLLMRQQFKRRLVDEPRPAPLSVVAPAES